MWREMRVKGDVEAVKNRLAELIFLVYKRIFY